MNQINENVYPFAWLDEIVEIKMNPDKTAVKSLDAAELKAIREQLPHEIHHVLDSLKHQTFSLYQNEQVTVIAGHYDQAIRLLQIQARYNIEQYPKTGPLRQTGVRVLQALDELSKHVFRRCGKFLPLPPNEDRGIPTEGNLLTKVLCALSADQLGIIIKAAFDVKLIIGRSFRKVCKAIAPFLSTPWKAEISWDTIRSISGRAERRDKEAAILVLEKMIASIKDSR